MTLVHDFWEWNIEHPNESLDEMYGRFRSRYLKIGVPSSDLDNLAAQCGLGSAKSPPSRRGHSLSRGMAWGILCKARDGKIESIPFANRTLPLMTAVRDQEGWTALHWTAWNDQTRFLATCCRTPTALKSVSDIYGRTPYDLAMTEEQPPSLFPAVTPRMGSGPPVDEDMDI